MMMAHAAETKSPLIDDMIAKKPANILQRVRKLGRR
jgi:hypothetical protein